VQTFPPIDQRSTAPGSASSWPQKLALSPDGTRLLVPLNLADHAAVIDLGYFERVRYVPTGSYPFGAAILPGGRIGLVTNEASGTLSVVDLKRGVRLTNITVGPPRSHPEGVVIDRNGARAYVALAASDQVVVVNLRRRDRRHPPADLARRAGTVQLDAGGPHPGG
jgi:DNA-binding beta-propeller fold protein YncE